ncbi:collagenase-like protease, PrtC family [Lentimicrobium saccharophilum]|uniref:Collagenase-like protease, PrtC family n=2 Tax=Lentimicrobium saccharophilum TaxID=1678841 RepID=A0A0S7BUY1_9BACT|nr:collagenase-like protease, PrtC family [Lentimicrobium saccharophilum]
MQEIEIMSPAGSFDALMAAIQGGAGSVYFGAGQLNMRARSSSNFSPDDIRRITEICREHGVKSYLTLNTIIYDEELPLMREMVDLAKKSGVSAIIASDLSVLDYARSQGVEIHISTQCNITNTEAVKFYAKYADVMVLARELNIGQMEGITRAIREELITGPKGELVQIEVFVHGALCMAVSGKCYISLDNFNSSANRGACMQPCRRAYHVKDVDNQIELEVDNKYIMSPKDLMTLPILDRLLDAGVTVLKIEGRGRSAEYVKTVTRTYHEAVEAWKNRQYTRENVEKWTAEVNKVYNRGFWSGYYLGEKTGEWSERYGSQATQKKVYIGKVVNFFAKLNVAEIKIETHSLSVGDSFLVIGPTTGAYEGKADEIRVELKPIGQAVKGDHCSVPVTETLRRGDKVYLVVDAGHPLFQVQTEKL